MAIRWEVGSQNGEHTRSRYGGNRIRSALDMSCFKSLEDIQEKMANRHLDKEILCSRGKVFLGIKV